MFWRAVLYYISAYKLTEAYNTVIRGSYVEINYLTEVKLEDL